MDLGLKGKVVLITGGSRDRPHVGLRPKGDGCNRIVQLSELKASAR
jgi:hypothetical protein